MEATVSGWKSTQTGKHGRRMMILTRTARQWPLMARFAGLLWIVSPTPKCHQRKNPPERTAWMFEPPNCEQDAQGTSTEYLRNQPHIGPSVQTSSSIRISSSNSPRVYSLPCDCHYCEPHRKKWKGQSPFWASLLELDAFLKVHHATPHFPLRLLAKSYAFTPLSKWSWFYIIFLFFTNYSKRFAHVPGYSDNGAKHDPLISPPFWYSSRFVIRSFFLQSFWQVWQLSFNTKFSFAFFVAG